MDKRSFIERAFRTSFSNWLVAVGAASAACTPVPAYQRARLAHPTMTPEFAASPARAHREAVQEGATGGQAHVSSGCGCN